MLDIHTHILPGVDDGAQTHRQSLQMLAAARDAGIDILVATPHLKPKMENLASITDAYNWLKPHAYEAGISLLMGYEMFYQVLLDVPFPELKKFCISGTNAILLELDSRHLFPHWNRVLECLVQSGYEPVIAHPERYVYIQEHPEIVGKIRRIGCRIQVSARAFLKPPWDVERRTAGKLKRLGWMDYIASDAHTPQDFKQMQAVLLKLQGHLPKEHSLAKSKFGLSTY